MSPTGWDEKRPVGPSPVPLRHSEGRARDRTQLRTFIVPSPRNELGRATVGPTPMVSTGLSLRLPLYYTLGSDRALWPAGGRREREYITHDKGYYHSYPGTGGGAIGAEAVLGRGSIPAWAGGLGGGRKRRLET